MKKIWLIIWALMWSGCSVIVANKLDEKNSLGSGQDSGIKRDKGNQSQDGQITRHDLWPMINDGIRPGLIDGSVVSSSKFKGEFGQNREFVIGELVLVDLTGINVNTPTVVLRTVNGAFSTRVPITLQPTPSGSKHGFFIPPGIGEGQTQVHVFNNDVELAQYVSEINIIRLIPVALANKNFLSLVDVRTQQLVASPHLSQVPLNANLYNPEPLLMSYSGRYLLLKTQNSTNAVYGLALVDLVLAQAKLIYFDQNSTTTLVGSPIDCAFTPLFMQLPAPDPFVIMPETELWIAAFPSNLPNPTKQLFRINISRQPNSFSLESKNQLSGVINAASLIDTAGGTPKARLFGAGGTNGFWYLDSKGGGPYWMNPSRRNYSLMASARRSDDGNLNTQGMITLYNVNGIINADIFEWWSDRTMIENPKLTQQTINPFSSTYFLTFTPRIMWPLPGTNLLGFIFDSAPASNFIYGSVLSASVTITTDSAFPIASNARLISLPTMNNARRLLVISQQNVGIYTAQAGEKNPFVASFAVKELQAAIHHPLEPTFFTLGAEGLSKTIYAQDQHTTDKPNMQFAASVGSSLAIQP